MNKLLIVLLALFLSSCATVKTPIPVSGSKSDATVTLAYEYGAFEEPIVDWNLAKLEARKRCLAWGYHNAEAFGGSQSHCVNYDPQYGCMTKQVNMMYQCVNNK